MRIQKEKKKKNIKEDFITSNVKAITDSEENLLVQQIGFVLKKEKKKILQMTFTAFMVFIGTLITYIYNSIQRSIRDYLQNLLPLIFEKLYLAPFTCTVLAPLLCAV